MYQRLTLLIIPLLLLMKFVQLSATTLSDELCGSVFLISNWKSNNVKMFDACDGSYLRDLDSQGLIDGPLGILQAPNGDLLVVSEKNNRLIQFDKETLSNGTVVMEEHFIESPSGVLLADDGFLYAASYKTNEIVQIDPTTWQIVQHILPAQNNHIKGIDAGMKITSSGMLLVPGYDSDNIIRINIKTKSVTEHVPEATEGLDAPRTIVLKEDTNEFFVTGERSNNVMVFDLDTGEYKRTLVEVARPTGLISQGQNLFINNHNALFRIDHAGKRGEKIIENGSGGLDSGTFVYLFNKPLPTDSQTAKGGHYE